MEIFRNHLQRGKIAGQPLLERLFGQEVLHHPDNRRAWKGSVSEQEPLVVIDESGGAV